MTNAEKLAATIIDTRTGKPAGCTAISLVPSAARRPRPRRWVVRLTKIDGGTATQEFTREAEARDYYDQALQSPGILAAECTPVGVAS